MNLTLKILAVLLLASQLSKAETQILCISSQDATNLSSDGVSLMDSGFKFELGVFAYGFVPTLGNTADWAENWNPAQRSSYKEDLKRYADSFVATTNSAPFTAGTPAYIWGFKGNPAAGEWVLFRANNWVWPTIGNGPPDFKIWDAKDATAVIGTVDASGNPCLMMPAAVSNLSPPATNYGQWVKEELAGETLVAATEDADGDGVANIFEFVAGTPPKVKGAPIQMPSQLVDVSGSKYLQLTVPRRSDRSATLVFEVSADLTTWKSGSGHTLEVSSSGISIVVRDLTPVTPGNPRRFIRVAASAP
jgi:hypothetical protein